MPNIRISDLPDGGSQIDENTLIEVELSGGNSRKVTLAQILQYLGINVGTLASLPAAANTTVGDNTLGFATNGRKGAETAGNGTGCLVMQVDDSNWRRVEDGAIVAI